jgi:hypothetical protein
LDAVLGRRWPINVNLPFPARNFNPSPYLINTDLPSIHSKKNNIFQINPFYIKKNTIFALGLVYNYAP